MAPAKTRLADPIKPLARLVQSTLTVADIVNRPLWCLRPDMQVNDALDAMDANGFDVGGVAGIPVAHFVRREALASATPGRKVKSVMQPILASQCVERSLPIGRLLELLTNHEMLFVLEGSDVGWLVNHSDLSATAVSIAVLAHLAAIEEGVKELATAFSDEHIRKSMSTGIAKAQENFDKLNSDGLEVSLLDCFYFRDWMNFVRNTDDLRVALGFDSRKEFKRFSQILSDLRNDTAHGRGILSSALNPSEALTSVGRAIGFARRIWDLVDEQQPIWDRFAETEIVFPRSSKSPLVGVGASKTWPWDDPIHVLTAWNPAGVWSHHSRNTEANERLAETLKRHKCQCNRVVGRSRDGKWAEDSLLVEGLKRQQAADIGLNFAQTAIFELDEENLHVVRCSDGEVVRTVPRIQNSSDLDRNSPNSPQALPVHAVPETSSGRRN